MVVNETPREVPVRATVPVRTILATIGLILATVVAVLFVRRVEQVLVWTPSFMGYSVGRWEGDTLVVESGGFNERTWLDFGGHPHTEALRMTERFQRRSVGVIDLQVTLEDKAGIAARGQCL